MRSLATVLALTLVLALNAGPARADAPVDLLSAYQLREMPADLHLQAYDDCGVRERQPHVRGEKYHTYNPGDVKGGDDRARTVAWDERQVEAAYEGLDPSVAYAVAITYANEPFNARTQSLWAGDVQLHGPHALPKGGTERLIFRVPPAAIRDGRLVLRFRVEGQVNVVVSAIELWSPAASPNVLRLGDLFGLYGDLHGKVLNLAYEPVAGAEVTWAGLASDSRPAQTAAKIVTNAAGGFSVPRAQFESAASNGLRISATHGQLRDEKTLPAADLNFKPVRYRPLPVEVAGLKEHQRSLDGEWQIHPAASTTARTEPLDSDGWKPFRVPGQWLQQGYDLPRDQAVAVAREFTIPAEWAGYRIMLRFDSIHAGTRYWLNGRELGASENLFTPVEWDITDAARVGQPNRLDLEMKVETPSEQLSYSSNYAFHNLAGIDRAVRIYALPPAHIRAMQLWTSLENGAGGVHLKLECDAPASMKDLSITAAVLGADGKEVTHSVTKLQPDSSGTALDISVKAPLPWNAEQPNLYKVVITLNAADKAEPPRSRSGLATLERIERQVGFRKIEIRDRQFYVNGRAIKLAGACRHETDPLTGRADTMRYAEGDLRLMKGANLNYLRTSHYPPPEELLDAADRLGMYVEVEAPFCWVGSSSDLGRLREVLTPTSAMIDYCHTHPSVMFWSLANESSWGPLFEVSHTLCRELDPTRPTTFNNPDPKRVCEIANLHYPPMPYEKPAAGDPRPILLGEYFYPVCHEQTDVRIDPGLRELWAAGHAEPDSAYGKAVALNRDQPLMLPGGLPGAWSHIVHSDALIGGAIWAFLDEPYYLPGGKRVGYAWVHGYWGLVDAWRRPKPEWWLAKLLFSPVWFPQRHVPLAPGQRSVRVPVENRYAFTDLSELEIAWELNGNSGAVRASVPPGKTGAIHIPLADGVKPGDAVTLTVKRAGEVVNALSVHLGTATPRELPRPRAGAPKWQKEGESVIIEGNGFTLTSPRSASAVGPILDFPRLHVTRFDFGDLGPQGSLPYGVLPDEKTRAIEDVTASDSADGATITVKDRYDGFAGSTTWLIDREGMGRVSYDYVYSGQPIHTREAGVKLLLARECDELHWRRWSEWDIYPPDHIGRTEGKARARRPGPDVPESVRPQWAWALDQTELGTNDFRGIKFNIYEAALLSPGGAGVRVRANADAHVRACLEEAGVRVHILSQCMLAPVVLKPGDHVKGEFVVEIVRKAGK